MVTTSELWDIIGSLHYKNNIIDVIFPLFIFPVIKRHYVVTLRHDVITSLRHTIQFNIKLIITVAQKASPHATTSVMNEKGMNFNRIYIIGLA